MRCLCMGADGGGGRWIRTTEGVSQQIYSLPPLAAWVSLRTPNPALSGRRSIVLRQCSGSLLS